MFRVCFESSFYEDDIQPEIQVAPWMESITYIECKVEEPTLC